MKGYSAIARHGAVGSARRFLSPLGGSICLRGRDPGQRRCTPCWAIIFRPGGADGMGDARPEVRSRRAVSIKLRRTPGFSSRLSGRVPWTTLRATKGCLIWPHRVRAKAPSPLRFAGAVHDAGGLAAGNPKSGFPKIRKGGPIPRCGLGWPDFSAGDRAN